jgi:hypothetical protein
MRRRLTALLAMVVMTVMLVAAPALADAGGSAHEGSCGLGKGLAHEVSRMRVRQGRPSGHCSLPRRPVARVTSRAAIKAGPGFSNQPRPFSLTLIHPSVSWPLPDHPEAMKMESPKVISHQYLEVWNSRRFLCRMLHGNPLRDGECPLVPPGHRRGITTCGGGE